MCRDLSCRDSTSRLRNLGQRPVYKRCRQTPRDRTQLKPWGFIFWYLKGDRRSITRICLVIHVSYTAETSITIIIDYIVVYTLASHWQVPERRTREASFHPLVSRNRTRNESVGEEENAKGTRLTNVASRESTVGRRRAEASRGYLAPAPDPSHMMLGGIRGP